ncbi:hypothetical protein R1080702_038 [Cyanophage S-RIM32]|uniref:Uncharacterized protein n=1 Tax=Cyanophage S-RIM32 TaxID=1278479 RepID=A0A127KLX7_9CAUD|nr:tail assembly chaperone [Cyanophage S-RIM32]AMO43047.1 hypothetical protein R1080702_038 [Cyanophage S-RIM32]
MTQTPMVKRPVLQIDLLNDYISVAPPDVADDPNDPDFAQLVTVQFTQELKDKFFEFIDSFWHTDDDRLEFFSYYTDGAYFCQRQRQKYDFERDSTYWQEYQFTGGTDEQAKRVYEIALATFYVQQKIKTILAAEKISAIEKQYTFFEKKYLKRKREKKLLLASTDWRVLPDIPDSYEGEKDRWFAWRAKIREVGVPDPENFSTGLEFLKSLYETVYPIDPELYLDKYPNGMLEDGVTPAPAFMDENDPEQWVNYDDDASKDFVDDRVINALIYARSRSNVTVSVKREIRDIIRLMKGEEIHPDFDSSLFVLE